MSVEHLRQVAAQATPYERHVALNSYFKYRQMVTDIAQKHGFSPRTGAAVFAALSPNNDYHGNLRDCHNLLQAAAQGCSMKSFGVSTYGPNKRKAWAIASGTDPFELITARKTRNFFLNIDNPLNPEPVTVDGHLFNCWRAERTSLVGLRHSARQYDEVAQGVRELAREEGILPCQMQGLLWITHRRIHRILTSGQSEFWDPDYLAARLGFHPTVSLAVETARHPCVPEP
jgi:hypothetical protein